MDSSKKCSVLSKPKTFSVQCSHGTLDTSLGCTSFEQEYAVCTLAILKRTVHMLHMLRMKGGATH